MSIPSLGDQSNAPSPLIATVKVRDLLSFAPGGTSAAVVAEDMNGDKYVVKFADNLQGSPHVLVNDLVGSTLARLLDLPCPEACIMDIDAGAIHRARKWLSQKYKQALPGAGLAFSCRSIDRAQKVTGMRGVALQAVNLADMAGVHMFDRWTHNGDRRTEGNLLLQRDMRGDKQWRLYMIDHGHICGGPRWTRAILDGNRRILLTPMPSEVMTSGFTSTEYAPYLARLVALSDATIADTVRAVPEHWFAGSSEIDALIRFSVERKPLVLQALSGP